MADLEARLGDIRHKSGVSLNKTSTAGSETQELSGSLKRLKYKYDTVN